MSQHRAFVIVVRFFSLAGAGVAVSSIASAAGFNSGQAVPIWNPYSDVRLRTEFESGDAARE
jgi:hypothetical protein